MDRVEENLKRIMQVASVIGREFAYRILQAIMGMREELKSQLLNLQGLEFIHEKQLFPELEYIFKHALTQEVAYNSLLLKRRKEIHDKIGQAIEELYPDRLEEYSELLAYHYLRSDYKVKAIEYLDLANRKAIRASLLQEAKAHFDQAMELLDALPKTGENHEQRLSMLVNQGDTFQFLLRMPEYYELLARYEPLTAEVGNPGLLGAFYGQLGHCEYILGSLEKSAQTLTKAAELSEAAEDASNAAYAYRRLAWNYIVMGDFHNSLSFTKKALRAMGQSFDLRTYTFIHSAASMAYQWLGLWDPAVAEGEEGLRTAYEFSDKISISLVAFHLAVVYVHKGDLNLAIEYGEQAMQTAPTPAEKARGEGVLGWIWCRSGEPTKGIEVLAPLVQILRDSRDVITLMSGTYALGEGYYLAQEFDKAKQNVEELLELAEHSGAKLYTGIAHRILGEIGLKTNPDEALPHFEKAISIFQEIKAENELALAYSGMGRYHKQQGNTEQAREYLSKALEIFERLGTLIEPDKVREELAELPQ
jgi:tetratricopeptide (TPR) repeat protein